MCGFVGIVAPSAGLGEIGAELSIALQALQHRGQDSAGVAVMDAAGARFQMRKGLGTAAQALPAEEVATLDGPIGIGHVRYPTIGSGKLEDTQPFFYRRPGILMAHNGNVTNYAALRRSLSERSIHLLSHCDVEPALCELADALNARRASHHTLEDAVAALTEMHARVRGAFSVVAALMIDDKPTLVVTRDANGIRPAVIGKRGGTWLVASESVALDALDYERFTHPGPGTAVFLRGGEEPVVREITGRAERAPCVFEYIYFARPDAIIEERSVYEVRLGLGTALGERIQEKGLEADVVIPVPDTARPAATAIAEHLELPLREGFIKNRYSGRTFIMPDALSRHAALRLKLNTLPREIEGRRVLLVDDSIVRGTTLRRVIGMVRDAGATEVHLAIHAPPVSHPCFYGIDMSTEEELFARKFGDGLELDALESAAASDLGADSLSYLPVATLNATFGSERCAACFDGAYPQPIPDEDRLAIAGDRRETGPRSSA